MTEVEQTQQNVAKHNKLRGVGEKKYNWENANIPDTFS